MWKKLGTSLKYENPWMKVYEDKVLRPDGKEGIYGFIDKPTGCRIIAETEDNEIFLITEERYPIGKKILELPAGVIGKDDSQPLDTAIRELYEETNLTASKWKQLGKIAIWPGVATTYDYVFLASEINGEPHNKNIDNDEAIVKIEKYKVTEIKDMILSGGIFCSVTLACLNIYFTYKENKKL